MIVFLYTKFLYALLFEYSVQKYCENVILDKIIIFVIFNLNIFAFICEIAICLHCCWLISFVYVSLTLVIFISLNQWYHLFNNTAIFNIILLYNFIKHHTHYLTFVLNFNKKFRWIFLNSMIVWFFGSVVECNTVLQGGNKIPFHYQLIQLFFILAQINIIIGVHFVCAKYTKKIHQCSKVLTLHYKSFSTKNWKSQWKLSNYIEKFHTKNRYGFTYGNFRLIDFFSFYKVFFIAKYFKTLIICSNYSFYSSMLAFVS